LQSRIRRFQLRQHALGRYRVAVAQGQPKLKLRGMNKQRLKDSAWKTRVRFRPIPQRYDGGPGGAPLPEADREWIIGPEMPGGMMMYCVNIPYGFVLGFDQVREFISDPIRGEGHGFLVLKVQVNTGGDHVWAEPLDPSANRALTAAFFE